MAKWNSDSLKIYVEKESSCEFLDYRVEERGKRNRIILRLRCGCSDKTEFEVQLDNFYTKKNPKKQCDICSQNNFKKIMSIPYENIKEYINGELGNGCTLITKKEDYISTKVKIEIQCECGNIFKTTFDTFKNANKRQCNECGTKIYIEKNTMTTQNLIDRVYELVQDEYTLLEEYKGYSNKIKIRHNCKKCNNYEYEILPTSFLSGTRCPECDKNRRIKRIRNKDIAKKCITNSQLATRLSQEFVFSEFEKVGLHIIEGQTYTSDSQHIKYICENHPNVIQEKNYQGVRSETGCPLCNKSKGEKKIRKFLTAGGINFKQEYIFRDLKGSKGGFLRFDFAIFDDKEQTKLNHILEFDGLQHFVASTRLGGDERFIITQAHDILKNEYCNKNGIRLIRIDYTHLRKLEKELDIMYMDFNKNGLIVM